MTPVDEDREKHTHHPNTFTSTFTFTIPQYHHHYRHPPFAFYVIKFAFSIATCSVGFIHIHTVTHASTCTFAIRFPHCGSHHSLSSPPSSPSSSSSPQPSPSSSRTKHALPAGVVTKSSKRHRRIRCVVQKCLCFMYLLSSLLFFVLVFFLWEEEEGNGMERNGTEWSGAMRDRESRSWPIGQKLPVK